VNENLHDWLNILIRWFHFIAGIMWIGTSLYFVWLDSAFKPPEQAKKGVDGEAWMVHGGNFYHVEKRKFGPGEMPKLLHWFIWEATLTWVSGFLLLIVIYYLTNGSYLIDPQVKNLSQTQAVLIGLSVIFGSWFFYDGLFRLVKGWWVNFLGLGILGFFIYWLTHTFSGRGAFIHVGAMFGTMMVLNVWVHILPNQRAIIKASNEGKDPDYELGKKAKTRSMHNSYMTLPVLFLMISNHFGDIFGHPQNWLALILIILLGALVRHTMITLKWWPLLPALASLLVVYMMTAETHKHEAVAETREVHFFQVNHILQTRCVQCHSQFATDEVFKGAPNNVSFDTPALISQWASRIYQRAVVEKTMPLVNKTQISEQERQLLGQWFLSGAKVQ
jgi:uncharacterized membrane protein